MTEPLYSFGLTARVLPVSGAVAVGDALVYDSTITHQGVAGWYVKATAANRTTADSRAQAIALTAYSGPAVGTVTFQATGPLAREVSGLAATTVGVYQLVRISTTGRLERVAGYSSGDDIVGYAYPDGRVALHIGLPWNLIASSATGGLDGWYNVTDYGAVGDGITDNAAAIEATILAAGDGSPAPVGGTVYFPPGTYYVSRAVNVNRQTRFVGSGFSGFYTPSRITWAAGKVAFYVHSSTSAAAAGTPGLGEDTTFEELAFFKTDYELLQADVPVWQAATAYVIGNKVRIANDNRYFWRCTGGGTSGADRPFGDEISPSTIPNQGVRLGITLGPGNPNGSDGTVSWICETDSGVVGYARFHVRRCYGYRTFNAPIVYFGKSSLDGSNVNDSSMSDCRWEQCGIGPIITGNDDANGISVISTKVVASGYRITGTGGFGFVNNSFLGAHFFGCSFEACTGRWMWDASGFAFSTYTACYVEGSQGTGVVKGLVSGGTFGTGWDNSVYVTGQAGGYWSRIWANLSASAGTPQLRFDEPGESAFLWRYDGGVTAFGLGERLVADSTGQRGWWAHGTSSAQNSLRRITGYSQQQSPQGAHHYRVYQGEFRGNGDAPYYVGYNSTSKTDAYVRFGADGCGGHYLVGDRVESGAAGVGEVCAVEGWGATGTWSGNAAVVTADTNLRLRPSSTVSPTVANGYAYVCTQAGTTHASVEPTWPTTVMGGAAGKYAPRWAARRERAVGEYIRPTTPNGHYYKVTSTTSYTAPDTRSYPNVYGLGVTGESEPTWPTGGGSTVTDGGLVWTEQGSITDATHFVVDGTAEWQCIGPVPTWAAYASGANGSNDAIQTSDGSGGFVGESSTLNATGLNLAVPLGGNSGPLKLRRLAITAPTSGTTKVLSSTDQEYAVLSNESGGTPVYTFELPAVANALYIIDGWYGNDTFVGTAAQIAAGHGGATGDITCPSSAVTTVLCDGTYYRKVAP